METTTGRTATRRVIVELAPSLMEALDAAVWERTNAVRTVTRSDIMREALDAYLASGAGRTS